MTPQDDADWSVTMIVAIRHGLHVEFDRELIRGGPLDDIPPGPYMFTLLCEAARVGDARMAAALLDAGALIDKCDISGMTPLQHATVFRHLDLARTLLRRHADPKIRDENGCGPLHSIATHYQEMADPVLLELGVEMVQAGADGNARGFGFTPFSRCPALAAECAHRTLDAAPPAQGGEGYIRRP